MFNLGLRLRASLFNRRNVNYKIRSKLIGSLYFFNLYNVTFNLYNVTRVIIRV